MIIGKVFLELSIMPIAVRYYIPSLDFPDEKSSLKTYLGCSAMGLINPPTLMLSIEIFDTFLMWVTVKEMAFTSSSLTMA